MRRIVTSTAITAKTTTGNGTAIGPLQNCRKTIQVTVVGTGAVAATVPVRVSNDNVAFILAATLNISGTTTATDGFTLDAPWVFIRIDVDAISGTGAALTATVAE